MRASVAPNGTLRISVPSLAPMFMVRRMISSSRNDLRKLMNAHPTINIRDGTQIGKSHVMLLRQGETTTVRRHGLRIVVTLQPGDTVHSPQLIKEVRTQILAALRKEAKHHLPHRIRHLATLHKLEYSSLRFTHASSRWGSCNSKQAISLNIALMNLPFELIDYVLVHELAHTVHLNHSKDFWNLVATMEPGYKQLRMQLKSHNPAI
jgi:predicted metal-dependent hydrolase